MSGLPSRFSLGPAMIAAVDAGVPLLVHTPHFGWVTSEEARKVTAAGVLNDLLRLT